MLKVGMHIFGKVSNTYAAHVQDIFVILQLKQCIIPLMLGSQKKTQQQIFDNLHYIYKVENNSYCIKSTLQFS